MGYTYSFEKLRVWQSSKELAIDIYRCTSTFPHSEKFGLTSQLRRAIVSVSSNIAEGSNRKSITEQQRYLEISYGSLMEVISQIEIAHALGYLQLTERNDLREKCGRLSLMMSKYKSTLISTKQ